MSKIIQVFIAYLPWILLVPVVPGVGDHPGFILIQLVPIALALLSVPGVIRASRRTGEPRLRSVRWSVVMHIASLLSPLVMSVVLLSHPAPPPTIVLY